MSRPSSMLALPLLGLIIFSLPVMASTSDQTKLIINIPAREVALIHLGEELFRFPIAIGSPRYKTPIVPRFLKKIVWNPWWLPPDSDWAKNSKPTPPGPGNPLGVVKMDLGAAILLHGTNKPSLIGRAVSHGCIRMRNEDARTLAQWIQTHLTDKKDPKLFEMYEKKRWQSFHVKVPQPIPVEVQYDVFHLFADKLRGHPDIYGRVAKKQEKILDLLTARGLKPHRIYQHALTRWLKDSQFKSKEISLKELFPGTISAYLHYIPDPIDEGWKVRERIPQRTNFPFLFWERSI